MGPWPVDRFCFGRLWPWSRVQSRDHFHGLVYLVNHDYCRSQVDKLVSVLRMQFIRLVRALAMPFSRDRLWSQLIDYVFVQWVVYWKFYWFITSHLFNNFFRVNNSWLAMPWDHDRSTVSCFGRLRPWPRVQNRYQSTPNIRKSINWCHSVRAHYC